MNNKQVQNAKFSFNTRRISKKSICGIKTKNCSPKSGDLVIARIAKIGQHTRIQYINGRRSRLYVGDNVIVCYSHRYAAHQFEAEIPKDLAPCHLIAAGGIASMMLSKHRQMKYPTEIEPLGLLVNENNKVINIHDASLPDIPISTYTSTIIIGVVGSEMNAGKTTTAANIVHSAKKLKLKVAAIKASGTGACGDYFELVDAGAEPVFDLVDAGFPSSYKLAEEDINSMFSKLLAHALSTKPAVLVIELGDGVLQSETNYILGLPIFKQHLNSIILATSDPVAALTGTKHLQSLGLPLTGVSGSVTQSKLACEQIETHTGLPVFTQDALRDKNSFHSLLPTLSKAMPS